MSDFSKLDTFLHKTHSEGSGVGLDKILNKEGGRGVGKKGVSL